MTNLFEQYPQGVPVRPSSPVNKQSFSSFVPSPATTQELQRRPKSTKSVWERLTTPLVSEERVSEETAINSAKQGFEEVERLLANHSEAV